MLLTAEPPRYLGGAAPTPLTVPGPVDGTPTSQACTTETLRRSIRCVFDARPIQHETDAARKKQGKDNLEVAVALGKGLCRERLVAADLDGKEKSRRLSSCEDATIRAAAGCTLDGTDALLDAEGRFSGRARSCYEALATSIQLSDAPPAPKPESSGSTAPPPSSASQPTKI